MDAKTTAAATGERVQSHGADNRDESNGAKVFSALLGVLVLFVVSIVGVAIYSEYVGPGTPDQTSGEKSPQ